MSGTLKKMLITRLGGCEAVTAFSDSELDTFMTLAIARLNRTGILTYWAIESREVVEFFPDVIVGWAAAMAWMSRVSPEAMREASTSTAGATPSTAAQRLIDLAKVEGEIFRIAHDKIWDTKRKLVPNSDTKWI
jgi:hypothetical protein